MNLGGLGLSAIADDGILADDGYLSWLGDLPLSSYCEERGATTGRQNQVAACAESSNSSLRSLCSTVTEFGLGDSVNILWGTSGGRIFSQ